jgi:hypothetical protein
LWIEKDTPRTPEPTRYYVFKQGFIVGERKGYRHLKKAQEKYEELRRAAGGGTLQPVGWAKLEPAEKSRVLADAAQEEMVARTELSWIGWRNHHQTTGRGRHRRR